MKQLMAVMLGVMMLATTAIAAAEQVHITPHGMKYHKADCVFVQDRDTVTMDEAEAEKEGYTPCKRCFKKEAEKEAKREASPKVKQVAKAAEK